MLFVKEAATFKSSNVAIGFNIFKMLFVCGCCFANKLSLTLLFINLSIIPFSSKTKEKSSLKKKS